MVAPEPSPASDSRCVYCGAVIDGPSWHVSNLLEHHPRRGQAHGSCVPWELEPAPYGHLVRDLPKEAETMTRRMRQGRILRACVLRMHSEWPLRARSRVGVVERLLRDYRGY